MRIMLVGGRQKANFLTKSLLAKGHHVTIVNENFEWCQFLSNTHDVIAVHGNGSKPYILADADVDKMDVLIALGHRDSNNLVICEIAKKQFGVKRTITIVNDIKNIALFKNLGVDKCISATQMITDMIEQEAVVEELRQYMPLENGKILMCELELSQHSPAVGKPIQEIGLPEQCILSCVLREEHTIIPKGNTVLQSGDRVFLLSAADWMERSTSLLAGK